MTPRIESAQVQGFRLVLPRAALEGLPEQAARDGLQVAVALQGTRVAVTVVGGGPSLGFQLLRGEQAQLASVDLQGDAQGRFLLHVLGPLVVRHAGDLEVRLSWSAPGQPQVLKVAAGRTDFPALAVQEAEPERPLTGEEREVQALLERAAAEWARYQQLKHKGG
jgi:hypothetical protein